MIDIHSHILFGVDDGAKDLEESIAMARMASSDGVTHMIATPHFFENGTTSKTNLLQKIETLQRALHAEDIPLTVLPGNEVRVNSAAFIYTHAQQDHFLYLNAAKGFVLLEQCWNHYNEDTPEIVDFFLHQQTRPIIPHPERHYFFREQPQLLMELIHQGAWTQVTADSLIGTNGKEAADFSKWLLQQNLVHTLATDAHNVKRKPNLSAGVQMAKQLANEAQTRAILERMEQVIA
ncbi:CpsB/CapC family capsule biosynthesis tyrosine phosphatase [Paenibacillus sp. HB172176]|uniref:tyrosine-protein phosphatase n=1 Tax=Paenibacillus sp. HB172176 TaxID=2493690 RepID=UPI001438C312|nr:CpsB/CapC family capsule biosynthesis tyrosine phosphatase [Paenibacillus sp. HB172176]